MTITYTAEVATCTGLGCFWRLLFRWKGSIYKLLWPNLLVYSAVYFILSCIYRFGLGTDNRRLFERIALHCQTYSDLIPIAFILGFYVSIVIKRWWDQYICMPWPDNLAMFVSTLVLGQDDRGRLMRRTIIRYVNLCLVITLRMMSPRVKKRFPTLDHLVEAGFLQPNEKKIFESLDQKTPHPKYWMPLVWAGSIITRARKEGRINNDFSMKTLIDELNTFRAGCGGMLNYDWISIPLVYTQVVTLAVYTYFVASLMANQFLDPTKGYAKHEIDLVFPVFTFLQFTFYMGWLKVAESLVNPFGEDDDDFELNWLVDRNLQVSYVIVDEMHQEHPEMIKDQYWDEVIPAELPYTAAAKQYQTGPPPNSADNVEVSLAQAEFMPLETVPEEIGDNRDELGDLDLDGDIHSGSRKETHPMKIMSRFKTGSSGSVNTGSFSGPRTSRKSSVLNMLTKIFRRDESSRDIASQMGSSASIHSRRAPRSNSRMSYLSQSQAQSRTSIFRENTFQDEMFRMSDVSLASAATTGSAIQMVAPREQEVKQHRGAGEGPEEEHEASEFSHLIPTAKNITLTKKVNKNPSAELKTVDPAPEDGSDASCTSAKTSFYQDWNLNVQASGTDVYPSSTPKVSESLKRGIRLTKGDWKDAPPVSPSVTFTESNVASDSQDHTTRVVIPNNPAIRQTFIPITASSFKEVKRKISDPKYDDTRPNYLKSSLTRSLQMNSFEESMKKHNADLNIDKPATIEINPVGEMVYEANTKSEPEPVITILPPISHFGDPSGATTVSDSYLPPSSAALTTTSVVTSTGTSILTTSLSSAPSVITQQESTVIDIQPDRISDGVGDYEEKKVSNVVPHESPSHVSVPIELEETEILDTEVPPVSQYIPSAAIPVPSVSPARQSSSTNILESDFELLEAALVPLSRRTHHDFHDLEPISEHGEISAESTMISNIHSEEPIDAEKIEREVLPT